MSQLLPVLVLFESYKNLKLNFPAFSDANRLIGTVYDHFDKIETGNILSFPKVTVHFATFLISTLNLPILTRCLKNNENEGKRNISFFLFHKPISLTHLDDSHLFHTVAGSTSPCQANILRTTDQQAKACIYCLQ
jgi:hypothetical protein